MKGGSGMALATRMIFAKKSLTTCTNFCFEEIIRCVPIVIEGVVG